MSDILMLYSTTDGQTLKICQRLQQVIERHGQRVDLRALDAMPQPDPADFDKVVIGASIRYGRHQPRVTDYLQRHRAVLTARPLAFFSVNLVARKAEKCQPDTNPYLRRFLDRLGWRPPVLAVFAGKLDYPRYSPLDRLAIRLIMWMTHGPADGRAVREFTDWDAVEAFGERIAGL